MKPKQEKSAYLIGIKGVAMTALAVYLKEKGYQVEGSDVDDKFVTDEVLKKHKINILRGFSDTNIIPGFDEVITTGAHGGMTNIEAKTALGMGIPVCTHGEYIGKLMDGYSGIAVAGCHGKTTTSAIIASLLRTNGYDPSYLIGTASINNFGAGGHYGKGGVLVSEADEYLSCPLTCRIPRFLWMNPGLICLTNIDFDHPDAYSDIDQLIATYGNFLSRLKKGGHLVVNGDDRNIRLLIRKNGKKCITFGFLKGNDFQIAGHRTKDGMTYMRVFRGKTDLGEFRLNLFGCHNMLNALAASISANLTGLGWEKIRKSLQLFSGTKRRFELVKKINNILFYDDYAHHPAEISATLTALKSLHSGRRVVAIFQPHTYSRTRALMKDFAGCFAEADLVLVSDIYASAREKKDDTVSAKALVENIALSGKKVRYQPGLESVLEFLRSEKDDSDVIITMGAGDIFNWQKDIISALEKGAV